MRLVLSWLTVVVLLFGSRVVAANAPYAGKFSDGKLIVELNAQGDSYSGSFTLNGRAFPATARLSGEHLDGTFTASGHTFIFAAVLNADTLTLTSDTSTYRLNRVGDEANPLAQGGSNNATSNGAPAGYSITNASDAGKSLVAQKPNVATVKAALQAVFPELATYFGSRPTLGTAYQDAKDPNSGGATFSGSFNNQSIRGIVSCKIKPDAGATVFVVYGRTDASKADWEKLMAPATSQDGKAQPAKEDPIEKLKSLGLTNLHQNDYPDGTGSIQIPEGWNVKGQSALHGVAISGPSDQVVVLHNSVMVFSPNSMFVTSRKRLDAQNAQMEARLPNFHPKPLPPLMAAEFTDPKTAVEEMVPQFSAQSEFNHGPTSTFDRLISSEDLPHPMMPNAQAAWVTYTFNRTTDGTTHLMRAKVALSIAKIGDGSAWQYFVGRNFLAPDESFDKELPIMQAIAATEKVDQERLIEVGEQENRQLQQMGQVMADAQRKVAQTQYEMFKESGETRYRIGQEQHEAQMEGYAQHNRQWQMDEWQKSRNAADYVETIRGTRTVYDTVTGASGYANLTDVNGVVNALNDAALDPNRFVQIPLRDELYPAPPPPLSR